MLQIKIVYTHGHQLNLMKYTEGNNRDQIKTCFDVMSTNKNRDTRSAHYGNILAFNMEMGYVW